MAVKIYIETKFNQKEYDFYYSYNFDSSTNGFLKGLSLSKTDSLRLSELNTGNYSLDYAYFTGGKDNYHRDYYTKIVFIYDSDEEKKQKAKDISGLYDYILKLLKGTNFNSADINLKLKRLNGPEKESMPPVKEIQTSHSKKKRNHRTKKRSMIYFSIIALFFCVIIISFIIIHNSTVSEASTQTQGSQSNDYSETVSLNKESSQEIPEEKGIDYFKEPDLDVSKKVVLKAGFFDVQFPLTSKKEITDLTEDIDAGKFDLNERTGYIVEFLNNKIPIYRYSYKNHSFFYCRFDFEQKDDQEKSGNKASFINENTGNSMYTEKIFGELRTLLTKEEKRFFIFVDFE